MSYEVLARRWRPNTFEEVSGQRHVTTALVNAIRLDRLPHAILLAGPRGIGKTTLARILARALNCDEGPTDKPCGKCSSCEQIASGASLDVQEIDAASNTGVDSVREIRESIRYAAAPGKYRIYVIDEVHMLSSAAFNALLKTLEEPPSRSLFVFATTDPQKIPVTVLSRVQRFDLKRLGPADALARLREIVAAEGIEIPESVLRALVREGEGSLRDSLTLLDRLSSSLGNKISEEEATAILDLIDRRILSDILDLVLAQDAAAALVAVRRALDKGIEPARLAGDLLSSLRDLLVARLVDDPKDLVDVAPDELAELCARAKQHDPETLQRMFRVLLARNQDLGWATRPEHALEMAVVRLATLPDAEALGSLIARLETLEGGEGGPGPSGAASDGGARGAAKAAGAGRRAAARASAVETRAPDAPPADEPPAEALAAEIPAIELSEIAVAQLPSAGSPAEPRPRRDAASDAQLRTKLKSHPSVRDVIETLDAELREIRMPRAPSSDEVLAEPAPGEAS